MQIFCQLNEINEKHALENICNSMNNKLHQQIQKKKLKWL